MAAIHYNHNSSRKQAVTKVGQRRFSVSFPKYKKGGHIVRKIKTSSTYGKCSVCVFLILLIVLPFFRVCRSIIGGSFSLGRESRCAWNQCGDNSTISEPSVSETRQTGCHKLSLQQIFKTTVISLIGIKIEKMC